MSKPVSIPPWLLLQDPALSSCPDFSSEWQCDLRVVTWNQSFPPQVAFGHNNRSKKVVKMQIAHKIINSYFNVMISTVSQPLSSWFEAAQLLSSYEDRAIAIHVETAAGMVWFLWENMGPKSIYPDKSHLWKDSTKQLLCLWAEVELLRLLLVDLGLNIQWAVTKLGASYCKERAACSSRPPRTEIITQILY